MERRFREPAMDILRLWLVEHCRSDADPTEVMRAVVDSVQTRVGADLLRQLPRTRAYHLTQGELEPFEVLEAGAVQRLIRKTAGMEVEPGEPTERRARRSLSDRFRGR